MTFFERMPVPSAHEPEEEAFAVHAFEGRKLEVPAQILGRYTGDSTRLALKGVQARAQIESLAADRTPEEVAALREKLSALIREAQVTLDTLASTTALSSSLSELAQGEGVGISKEQIAENPELAQKLLEGVVEVGAHIPESDLPSKNLAKDAQVVLKDMHLSKHTGKIALTVAERIFKIVLDANTFGFGGAAYDTIKDVVRAFKSRNKPITA